MIQTNNNSGKLITDDQMIKYIIKQINYNYYYKERGLDTYPAPQPVSIEKKDFVKFKNYEYNIGLKLDGVRYILYLFKNNQNINTGVIINRSLQCYSIDISGDPSLFHGTILDGELCKNNFIIHDGVLVGGTRINKLTHDDRLNSITRFLNNNTINSDEYTFVTKKFYKFSELNNFIENEYKNKNYSNDGIIFMPNKLPVMSGTQYSMLKWKPPTKHTCDFLIKEDGESFGAYVYHLKSITLFANINFLNESGKLFINTTKKLNNYKDNCILECVYENNNFVPLVIRTDKSHCNSLRTVERTLFNINENITLEDFQSFCPTINQNR